MCVKHSRLFFWSYKGKVKALARWYFCEELAHIFWGKKKKKEAWFKKGAECAPGEWCKHCAFSGPLPSTGLPASSCRIVDLQVCFEAHLASTREAEMSGCHLAAVVRFRALNACLPVCLPTENPDHRMGKSVFSDGLAPDNPDKQTTSYWSQWPEGRGTVHSASSCEHYLVAGCHTWKKRCIHCDVLIDRLLD